jgi:hypothetical protein
VQTVEFTVQLRYQSGSSTILSTEADTADEALNKVRDPRRSLIGISITGPPDDRSAQPDDRADNRRPAPNGLRRDPVRHRPSRRRH